MLLWHFWFFFLENPFCYHLKGKSSVNSSSGHTGWGWAKLNQELQPSHASGHRSSNTWVISCCFLKHIKKLDWKWSGIPVAYGAARGGLTHCRTASIPRFWLLIYLLSWRREHGALCDFLANAKHALQLPSKVLLACLAEPKCDYCWWLGIVFIFAGKIYRFIARSSWRFFFFFTLAK